MNSVKDSLEVPTVLNHHGSAFILTENSGALVLSFNYELMHKTLKKSPKKNSEHISNKTLMQYFGKTLTWFLKNAFKKMCSISSFEDVVAVCLQSSILSFSSTSIGSKKSWTWLRNSTITTVWEAVQVAGLHPQHFWSNRFRMELEICISNQFPGDVDAAVLGTRLWEPLVTKVRS